MVFLISTSINRTMKVLAQTAIPVFKTNYPAPFYSLTELDLLIVFKWTV